MTSPPLIMQQGSRLLADYEVSWDKDGFFRISRSQNQDKYSEPHYRSEAPRRVISRHSPEYSRPKRFKVRGNFFDAEIR